MRKIKDENRGGDRLVALFLLGMVLFHPLVVSIFDVGARGSLFGIPTLYLYLFVAWGVLIALIAVVAEKLPKNTLPPPASARPAAKNQRG